ncbi:16620_t:CDS:2 [Racocetra fulgida]|uniref:16620_t:CDS:1 n=1 Tax=Racocetra fulgida TaxID=60492 RepID=A0A9N8Z8D4_9GLOM|nr:16620_t:CDS:2 [Racocetra fulgida]
MFFELFSQNSEIVGGPENLLTRRFDKSSKVKPDFFKLGIFDATAKHYTPFTKVTTSIGGEHYGGLGTIKYDMIKWDS